MDFETDEVLPPGSKGIVKVRGPQVMSGYYKVMLFPWIELIIWSYKLSYDMKILRYGVYIYIVFVADYSYSF